jgi:PAS domain S-box-containing protein
MRIRCLCCLAAVSLFVALLLHAPIVAASTPHHATDILLLSSYHAGDSWTDELVAGVRSVLQANGVHDIHVEHLDARRHGKEAYDAYFRDYLRRKYADIPLALAIVADDAAFEFFLRFRREFFPELPLVFCGVNNFNPSHIQGERLVTGVNETLDIAGTVNLALKLVPRAERLAVVGGDSGVAKKNLELFHAAAPQFERALEIIELLDVRRGETSEVLGSLPERTLLFRMANLREDGGGDLSLQESAHLISQHANAPMFTFWEFDIGHGAVGGIVASGFQQGRAAAELARRILEGESADAIPVVMQSPNVPMFDFARMRSFGFKEAKLPESAEFVNKPFSLSERLKKVVWTVLALMALMVVSIVALLVALHTRRKSERVSRANERFLRSLLETIPNPIYYKDAQGRYLGCNNAFAEMLGLTREQVIGRTVHEVNQGELASFFTDKDTELMQTPGVQVYEGRLRDGQGQIRDVLLSKATYTGASEEVAGIVGMILDITERKRGEEALRESENRLKLMVEHLPSGAVFVEGERLLVNTTCATITGYAPEELAGLDDWFRCLYGEKAAEVRTLYEHDRAEGFRSPREITIIRRDGVERGVEFFCYLDDTVEVWLLNDITQRKEAEAAEKRIRERMASILRAAPVGIGVVKDRVFQEVNHTFCRMLGYGAEELVGNSSLMVYPSREEYDDVGTRKYAQINAAGVGSVETRFRTKDGRVLDILLSSCPLDPEDLGRGVTFTALDISHLKRTERELRASEESIRESEARFRLLVENAGDAIFLSDKTGRFVDVNAEAERQCGFSRDELLRARFQDIVPELDTRLLLDLLRPDSPRRTVTFQTTHLCRDGGTRPIEVRAAAVDKDGVPHVLGIARDITERKQVQEMLQRAKEAAESANRSKSEFLANMSHEIRTPLNGVMGMLRLVRAAPLNDELREYVEAAALSCKRLTALLSDILDLSRIEAGKMEIVNDVFDPRKAMAEVEGVFGLTAANKGVILECSMDQGVPRLLLGDVMRLRQVLLNIVGNAVKFTSRGAVSVKAWALPGVHADGVRLYVAVSDTGPGMTPELMETIFEPFAQGEASYTRKHQGAGLGLPIVKRLVRLMGGSLALESAPGEGSVFHLCIPFALAGEGERAASDAEPVEAVGPRVCYRILLVEDELVNQLATKRLLQMQGHDVHTAENGLQALQALREKLFDLVLMDVQMPEMDGLEATRMIREAQEFAAIAAIPIVALTAYAMDGDRERFLAAGMDDYLAKPVDEVMLADVIRRVMTSKG